jgi:hypothetical protein
MAACPYGVRAFNWGYPEYSPGIDFPVGHQAEQQAAQSAMMNQMLMMGMLGGMGMGMYGPAMNTGWGGLWI